MIFITSMGGEDSVSYMTWRCKCRFEHPRHSHDSMADGFLVLELMFLNGFFLVPRFGGWERLLKVVGLEGKMGLFSDLFVPCMLSRT